MSIRGRRKWHGKTKWRITFDHYYYAADRAIIIQTPIDKIVKATV